MSDPFLSIVVASRNRPQLLRLALESIFGQSFQDFEVILVNDGSDEEHLPGMQALVDAHPGRIRRIDLVRYPRGHGQSYALNTGSFAGRGEFVTFLDDDDFWTDMQHLEKAHAALQASPSADVYYANQLAVQVGQPPESGEVLWLDQCEQACRATGIAANDGIYPVGVEQLLPGFAHLNCTVMRRGLFLSLKGMDEDIRWECDRDFYLRTIEHAQGILFNPDVVSQHNVPDKTRSDNMTTAISLYQRLNYQIYVFNKATMLSRHPSILAYARQQKTYCLKKVAEAKLAEGRYADAHFFSAQALFMDGSWKWWLQHLRIRLMRLLRG